MGLRAVKVHPRLQNVDLSGPTHEDLWRALNDARFPLVVDAYPQSATASVPIAHMLPFAYEEHVRKYTEIQFVLAHAGAHRVLDTYFLCRSLRNYHCDLSYTATALRGTSVEADMRFVVTNADRKVMFGSDFPEVSLAEALEAFRALCHGVAEEKRANVFARNAAALYWGEE
jgi:predicted TIM-barrel fold metal-dependent hydrolase